MKKITTILVIGVVFSVLLGHSFVGTRTSYARVSFDCESDRFNAVLAADSTYTSAFRLWYRNDPTTCQQQCTAQCSGSSSPTCVSDCLDSCPTDRHDAYLSAQDALSAAGSAPCSYNPDQCADARDKRDMCLATLNGQWENPMYDENNNIDINWRFYVSNEYMTCYAASGMDNCE
jgi:hypothetical protein